MTRLLRPALNARFLAAVLLAIVAPAAADEIEILELSPSPPATLDGMAASPPGTIVSATAGNTITVVVRYRVDSHPAAIVNVFGNLSTPAGVRSVLVPPMGTTPPCGEIRGPASGRCASAFAVICPDRATATVSIATCRIDTSDEASTTSLFALAPQPEPSIATPTAHSIIIVLFIVRLLVGDVVRPTESPSAKTMPTTRSGERSALRG